MVVLLEAELKIALAVEGDVTEVTFEFPILLAVQNLLGCWCELKSSSELLLMGFYVSYNVRSAAHLSQITLYTHFLFVREKKKKAGTEEGGRSIFPLLMKLENI